MWKIFLMLLLFVTPVSAEAPCKSDFNCDGYVTTLDYMRILDDFGRGPYNNPCTCSLPCDGDYDCDSDVDGSDMVEFQLDMIQVLGEMCPMCVHTDCCQ